MASITQQIGNYKSGISELPDELKSPGQVVDLKNAIPDITRGCIKRPGSDLVSTIVPTATGKWFPIYTEQDEQYIGQVQTTGVIKIWRCSDGAEIPIDYADVDGTNLATYLIHTNSDEIQPLTINETTFFANRNKTVAMKTDSVSKTPAIINEAFVALKTIAYGKQYALDIFDPTNHSTVTYNRATAIEADEDVDTSGISGYSNDGKCEGMGRHIVGATSTNSGTSYMAGGTGKSNLRYEMDCRCTPVPQPGSVSSAYDDSYQPHAYLQFGGEGWTTNDTHDYTSNKGLQTQVKVTSHVAITARANVALVRPEPSSSSAEENVSAESILAGIKNAIDAISGTNLIVTTTGNGLHIYRTSAFNLTTTETQLMEIITNEANSPDELPKTCRHGYVVKVVNSGEDQDDYYLKFKVKNIAEDNSVTGTYARSGTTVTITSNGHGLSNGDTIITDFTSGEGTDGWYTVANSTTNTFTVTDSVSGTTSGNVTFRPNRFGEGVWEECAAPSLETKFDTSTMPIKLTRVVPSTQHTIATSNVNVSNEQITITSHGLSTGDTVLYDNGGGTTLAGLSDDTVYYVIKASDNNIALASDLTNANAGVAVNLTGTGNNAQTLTHGYFSINGGSNTHYGNGAFKFDYPSWNDRDVGDDLTNPKPSFVGNKINKIFFFRNRIGLLSGNNVILSRVNDFHNFWAKTAFTIANADPIDLQSTSTYPTDLFDAIEVKAGLLLFSASQQFLLKTDEAQLTPETAIVSFLSSYAFNPKTKPFTLGQTAGWLNSTSKRTRFHEMADVRRDGDPQVIEQTRTISKLFPDDITMIAESTESQMVLFASENKNEVWGYKFYTQGERRVQSAWFRWELPGTVSFHCMMDDTYYAILKNGSTYSMQAFDIKKATDTLVVGTAPLDYLIHLDTKSSIGSASLTYNPATNKTSMTKPTGYDNSGQLAVFCKTAGDNIGRFSKATVDGSNLVWDGEWTGLDIILGYLYEMEVELPTIYIQKATGESIRSETRGSLVVHRLNFSFGSVGLIDVTLKRKGREDYNQSYESIDWDSYLANTLSVSEEFVHTIPVYDRNTNLSVHLNSTHPSPATLNSMTWEGDYNSKFYQRV